MVNEIVWSDSCPVNGGKRTDLVTRIVPVPIYNVYGFTIGYRAIVMS